MNITKGQTVYVKLQGNAVRYIKSDSADDYTKEGIVVAIGSKYITVEFGGYHTIKFDKKGNQVTQYCKDYQLYETKQEIIDEFEINKLSRFIKNKFDYYGTHPFTLEQLRKIKAIIELEE